MITSIVLNPAVDKIYFVDGFEAGKLYRVKNTLRSAGGKGINVARVASTLGEQLSVIGFKAGWTGEWIEQQVKNIGIETNFIGVDGETRTNSNIIDRAGKTETELLESGPVISSDDIGKFLNAFNVKLKDSKVFVCSGGFPEGVPIDFYKTLINEAKKYELKVLLDASGGILEEGIKAKPYMVKPNLRELSKYVGKELNGLDEVIEACGKILSEGVEVVIASMGKKGAVLVSDTKVLLAKLPEVCIVNTIGSGDSLVAGFAAGIARECAIEDAFLLGVSCAVSNAQHEEVGVIDIKEVEKYLKEIHIQKV